MGTLDATVIVERFHTEYPDQEITVLRDGKVLTYAKVTDTEKSALSDA